ncbi:MAG: hypothetical protein SOU06_01250 [Bulleidia sp.]|nr:hypothetical protein [Erysipelotrichaceae bacterium]MDY2780146.1 hypothetical protein [Bulleidia sp.]
MAKPRKEGKTINFMLSYDTIAKIAKYCEATGSTKTSCVELAVDKYVTEFFEKNKDLEK